MKQQLSHASDRSKMELISGGSLISAADERRLRHLERENQFLRDKQSNADLLEEELRTWRLKESTLAERELVCAEIELQNSQLLSRANEANDVLNMLQMTG